MKLDDFTKATDDAILRAAAENSNKDYRKVNVPFGYFGSKNKIAFQLCKQLPPHNCWVEAFCGSAALTLAKPPAAIEVINDVDGEIVNLFEQLRSNSEELCRLVALTPYAREELLQARTTTANENPLERARKFLVQAMFAINGIFGKERSGFSYSQSYSRNGKDARVSRWYNLPERLTEVVERLRGARIENRDATEVLEMFMCRPASLIYLDPPYLGGRTKGYTNDATDESYHLKLLELANKSRSMIFISGYDNELYNDYLSEDRGWNRRTIDTITKGNNGRSHLRVEVVWENKHFQKATRSGRVPIRLSRIEKRDNKVNPERH